MRDRLVAHIVATLVPATQPRLRRRAAVSATTAADAGIQRRSLRAAARRWNDLLGIWRQCAKPDCRRSRCCAGDPLSCLPGHLPRLPQPVRLWFACIGVAAEKNLSFVEALAQAESEGDEAACARWHAAVCQALKARRTPQTRMNDL